MRKIILNAVIVVFALSVTFLIAETINKTHKYKQISKKIQKLPSFSFTTLDNKPFSSLEITKGPVLVVRYHPECEHCQYEISEIMKSNIPASGAIIIMVSSASPDSIREFINQFDFSDYPSIIPLVDTSYVFADIFGSDKVPSNYLYNKELDLVKVFYGEVKTETIFKYLRGSEQN